MPSCGCGKMTETDSLDKVGDMRSGGGGVTGDLPGKIQQDLMRLKVNRAAMVQDLQVEDILNEMVDGGVFTLDDANMVLKSCVREERVRKFLDILRTKTENHAWYRTFRNSLSNPSEECDEANRKQYKVLVALLDGTIIRKTRYQGSTFSSALRLVHPPDAALSTALPSGLFSYPSTQLTIIPPIEVTDLSHAINDMLVDEDATTCMTMFTECPDGVTITVQDTRQSGSMSRDVSDHTARDVTDHTPHDVSDHTAPDTESHPTAIFRPMDLYGLLLEEYPDTAMDLVHDEKHEYEVAKNLELVLEMYYKQCTPNKFQLADNETVLEIINDVDHHHLIVKHLRSITSHHHYNFMYDIVHSFATILDDSHTIHSDVEVLKGLVQRALTFAELLMMTNAYGELDDLLYVLICFLQKQKEKFNVLIPLFNCYVLQMQLCNINHNFQATNKAYFRAMEVVCEIENISLGQKVLDCTDYYIALSNMLQELGSITSAHSWSIKAMQEVTVAKDPSAVVQVLANSVICYCALWNAQEACSVAIQTVRVAKQHFGTRNPMYLHALLHCCHYLNMFQHNIAAVEIAELTVKTARLVYTCNTLDTAFSHLALSKALVNAQNTYDNDRYYKQAIKAFEAAKAVLPEGHPMMHHFFLQMATVLHVKAMHSADVNDKHNDLGKADKFALEAQKIIKVEYGDVSLHNGHVEALLGKLYVSSEQYMEAERCLLLSISIFSGCVTEESNYVKHAKAQLAAFYRTCGKVQLAYNLFDEIVKSTDTDSLYLEWMHTCYEDLILLLRYRDNEDEAELLKLRLIRWLASKIQNARTDITVAKLSEPPEPDDKFFNWLKRWNSDLGKSIIKHEELLHTTTSSLIRSNSLSKKPSPSMQLLRHKDSSMIVLPPVKQTSLLPLKYHSPKSYHHYPSPESPDAHNPFHPRYHSRQHNVPHNPHSCGL